MNLRRLSLVSACLLLGCSGDPPPPEEPGVEEPIPYDGPSSGVIPVFEEGALDAGEALIDAGEVVVETTCCATHFHIDDQEPADATGMLEGEAQFFGNGIPLSRDDGGWNATACVTINTSTFYWYRFRWDAGTYDAGLIELEDGGSFISILPAEGTSLRASASERSYQDSNGVERNYYTAVSDCSGLDGGVP